MTVIKHPGNGPVRLVIRGHSVRLKAPEGTFSYYHPDRTFTRFSWDAQTASMLFRRNPIESLLILGLGGGTVARQCRLLFPKAMIVGIEIDPWIIRMARDYFDLDSLDIKTFIGPAKAYLEGCRREHDAIIDDVWNADPGTSKPIFCDDEWIELITSLLRPDGVYAVNLWNRWGDHPQISAAGKRLNSMFPDLREAHPMHGPTSVLSAGRDLLKPREARSRLQQLPPAIRRGLDHVRFVSHKIKRKEV